MFRTRASISFVRLLLWFVHYTVVLLLRSQFSTSSKNRVRKLVTTRSRRFRTAWLWSHRNRRVHSQYIYSLQDELDFLIYLLKRRQPPPIRSLAWVSAIFSGHKYLDLRPNPHFAAIQIIKLASEDHCSNESIVVNVDCQAWWAGYSRKRWINAFECCRIWKRVEGKYDSWPHEASRSCDRGSAEIARMPMLNSLMGISLI